MSKAEDIRKRNQLAKQKSRGNLISRLEGVGRFIRRVSWYSDVEVSPVFRDDAITHCYRKPGRSWMYYLGSLFRLHNETINVWSHLLGFCYLVYKIVAMRLDYTHDPWTWPVCAFAASAMACTLFSALAHLLHSKSLKVHFICYQIDYLGIALIIQGTGIYHYYFVAPASFYSTFGHWFLFINALNAVAVCVGCSVHQICYTNPKPQASVLWRLGPATFAVVFASLPIFYKTGQCLESSDCSEDSYLSTHYSILTWTAVETFCYISRFPERLAPGCFNIVGHSHSFFHVIVLFTTNMQLTVAYSEYKNRNPESALYIIPSVFNIYGPQCLTLFLSLLFIWYSGVFRDKMIEEQCAEEVEDETQFSSILDQSPGLSRKED